MTSVFFVRHAQPEHSWEDDRTRPLTSLGMEDRGMVTEVLLKFDIDTFISSPYKRSIDTITDCADKLKMKILTDERLRERKKGIKSGDYLNKRWEDFTFCEQNGETLGSVQQRNISALKEILLNYNDKNIVIGTHGTALSTIMNYYDNSFSCNYF